MACSRHWCVCSWYVVCLTVCVCVSDCVCVCLAVCVCVSAAGPVMDSDNEATSYDSSASDTKPRPVGGGSCDEADGMVYYPPHFPQQHQRRSGSDFSPHSETSEENDTSPSEPDCSVTPPIRTYALPPTHDHHNSDFEGMESGLGRHGSAPVPVRGQPVNYKQFYLAGESSDSSSESGREVGWGRKTGRKVRSSTIHYIRT